LEEIAAQIAQPTLAGPAAPKRQSPIKLVEKAIDENEELAAEVLRQWIREG
jgi:flagellar biosynthesis/type III secretory pathway M-ring protein FliF/YscJ